MMMMMMMMMMFLSLIWNGRDAEHATRALAMEVLQGTPIQDEEEEEKVRKQEENRHPRGPLSTPKPGSEFFAELSLASLHKGAPLLSNLANLLEFSQYLSAAKEDLWDVATSTLWCVLLLGPFFCDAYHGQIGMDAYTLCPGGKHPSHIRQHKEARQLCGDDGDRCQMS